MTNIKSLYITEMLLTYEYDSSLIEIVMEAIEWMIDNGEQPTITSAYRPNDSGVHGCGRGVDFRSWTMGKVKVEKLVNYLNDRWIYDIQRPNMKVAIHHDTGRGPHIHLQSHLRTQQRRPI